ncbi:hypothetical protein DXT97_12355 [Agrobacterium tumefaciens]|uniref:hypothetical protein n=1 Tax=Agrobacterium tumefaciens TaxID=358 RepID=UPI001297676B|nr:hypothetical protein [Agrobacterium tumefaciens]MQB37583.1 hypothetical protein [Agrobacterium tumefaciens]
MAFYTDGVVPWNSLDDNTRGPLASELESGYPCGEADQQLFNWTAGWPVGNIWNMLLQSGITPDTDKLLDLARAIQSGKVNFAVAAGTANALTAALSPVPASLSAGLTLLLNVTTPNTGAATLNLNGFGVKPIVNIFGAALSGGELMGLVRLDYDGTQWRSLVTTAGLTANRTYYVNASTGSDTNSGLTAGTALATIQKAVNVVSLVNLNGFTATISVADGTYADFGTKALTGSGSVQITGNVTSPQNVQVNGASGRSGIFVAHSGYTFEGLSPLGNGSGVPNISIAAPVNIGAMYHRAAPANAAQILVGLGAAVTISGKHTIAGNATAHIYANNGGSIQSSTTLQPVMEFVASSNFTEGVVLSANGSFVGVTYSSFITPGLAPGKKFTAAVNGVINVNGAGINYFPGASAGTTATGGQYV